MKLLGVVVALAGLVAMVIVLHIDPSVETSAGTRVNNIGLMAAKQDYLIASEVALIVGVLLFGFGAVAESSARPESHPLSDSDEFTGVLEGDDGEPPADADEAIIEGLFS